MKEATIRIIAADDHDFLLDGLAALIAGEPGVELVGRAKNGRQLIELARSLSPDLIITDLRMPDMSGIDAVKELGSMERVPASIILSMFDDDYLVLEAARAGVLGYVTKGAPKEEMAAAIQSVSRNIPYYCPAAGGKLANYFHPKTGMVAAEQSDNTFTEEEKEIIRMICDGKNTDEICKTLFKSRTVVGEARITDRKKIGGRHLSDIIKFAIRNGIIKGD